MRIGTRTAKKRAPATVPTTRIAVGVSLLLLLLVFLLPIVFLSGRPLELAPPPEAQPDEPLPAAPNAVEPLPQREGSYADDTALIRVHMGDGSLFETPMYDYLWHVVAAEMPASFEPEALKAQTVAARTYALRKMQTGEPKHPEADVCTDITCCQAFITRGAAAEAWGEGAAAYSEKITAAVDGTRGRVITYDGQIIDAVFHSSSAGRTADAAEVWGNAVPYLIGVETPEGEGDVPNYRTTGTVSADEFKQLIHDLYPAAVLTGDPSGWFQNTTRTASGAVATVEVGGVPLTGPQLRAMCALRSARFTIRTSPSEIVFDVIAYGHGVGLSQYGANALAKEGKGFEEILKWYYSGVAVGAV